MELWQHKKESKKLLDYMCNRLLLTRLTVIPRYGSDSLDNLVVNTSTFIRHRLIVIPSFKKTSELGEPLYLSFLSSVTTEAVNIEIFRWLVELQKEAASHNSETAERHHEAREFGWYSVCSERVKNTRCKWQSNQVITHCPHQV